MPNYFSESLNKKCALCDNCQAGIITEDSDFLPLPINSCVIHTHFGKGCVMRYESDKMVVLFDKLGYKTLAVELAQRLLKQID